MSTRARTFLRVASLAFLPVEIFICALGDVRGAVVVVGGGDKVAQRVPWRSAGQRVVGQATQPSAKQLRLGEPRFERATLVIEIERSALPRLPKRLHFRGAY